MLILLIILCLAAGSATDTGNICVVRTASDLAAGKPERAVGTLLTVACAASVIFAETTFGWQRYPAPWSYPTLFTVAGAAVFAIGALVNGACAIGTIGRLARGEVGYLATLAGAAVVTFLIAPIAAPVEASGPSLMTGANWLAIVIVTATLAIGLGRHLLSLRSLAAYGVLGLAAASLAALRGDWTWLGVMQQLRDGMSPDVLAILCLGAFIGGAAMTAMFRHRFHVVWPDRNAVLREGAGGGLMALGTILIPGGNDGLLIRGVPSGSPLALAAYAVMFTLMIAMIRLLPLCRRWAVWPQWRTS